MDTANVWMDPYFLFKCLFLMLMSKLASPAEVLLFGTPGGRGFKPGFYASELDISKNMYPRNITKVSQNCIDLKSLISDGNIVQSIHLDLMTATVLVRFGSTTDFSTVTLFKAPLCQRLGSSSCDEKVSLQPLMVNAPTYSYYISAFASFDDHIYFITQTETQGHSPATKLKLIELRSLSECKSSAKIPYTSSSAFSVEACSKLISRIVEEEYNVTSRYEVTSGLAIIPTSTGNVFYTQILYSPRNKNTLSGDFPTNTITLYRITEDGNSEALHEEYVTSDYMRFVIRGLGQIAYRNKLLCWAALDRIVCAQIDRNGRISHARTVMESGEASDVCDASPSEPFLSTVATGVAIAKSPDDITRDETVVYFGCIDTVRSLGGAGVVRKTGNQPGSVQLLRENRVTIYAGSMLITDRCSASEVVELRFMDSGASSVTCKSTVLFVMVFIYSVILSTCTL